MSRQFVLDTVEGWKIKCPACTYHIFPRHRLQNGSLWIFDGNLFCPTFSPSMNQLMKFSEVDPTRPDRRCHFIISAGRMMFCGDCTHRYCGETIDMIPFDDIEIKMAAIGVEEAKARGEYK